MDPRFSAQDVLRCDLCETPVPPMYCDLCHVKLCKVCVGEHLSDLSKEHKVVPFKHRGSTPNYPKCSKHKNKPCELHCEKCDIPVCSLCVSDKHKGHTFLNIMQKFNAKKEEMKSDLQELEKYLHPRYEEIASEIDDEKSSLDKEYGKLTTAVTKQGEDWQREINIIVNKQKSEIDEMKTKHSAALDKQENEIKHIISDVKRSIFDLKRILDSNDISLTSAYKSRNAEFRSLPPKVKVSKPCFFPQKITTAQLHQMFGSLSALSITTEEHGHAMQSAEAVSCPPVKPLLEEPELITTIDTGFPLQSVTCLSDEEIWTHVYDKVMKLYNLQGKLLKSIQTKSGNYPQDIAVTSSRLVYTDTITKTVNIVKNKQIQEVIRLQGWKPYHVCSTFSDELLVTMTSDDWKQSKVVRYSRTFSRKKQTIQFDSNGKPLYSSGNLKYISENKNLDICVADNRAKAVVVVNQAGKLRFRYTGHPSSTKRSFDPYGITTDSQSQILTSDYNNHRIHILDQDGQFLCYIDNCDLKSPKGLCLDIRDNLYVAEWSSGKVMKIKYM